MKAVRDSWKEYRFIIFGLVFSVYAARSGSWVLGPLQESFTVGKTRPGLAILIFLFLILETWALLVRRRELARDYFFNRERPEKRPAGKEFSPPLGMLFAIAHMVVGMVLVMVGLTLAGFPLEGEDVDAIPGLFLFVGVIRELVVLFAVVAPVERSEVNPEPVAPAREIGADLVLFLFSMVGYTLTWGFLASTGKPGLASPNWGISLVYSLVSTLLFLIFYLPLNMSFFLEQFTFNHQPRQWLGLFLSLFLSVAGALYPLFAIPVDTPIEVWRARQERPAPNP